MSIDASRKKTKKSRRAKKSTKVSFDAELITRDSAREILSKHTNEKVPESESTTVVEVVEKNPPKESPGDVFEATSVIPEDTTARPKKPKKRSLTHNDTAKKQTTNTNTEKTEESIRAKKRRKHAELLQNKKIQAELHLQQKGLNYLSRWKHNRAEWKFEKLRQIWLRQNMYDDAKIPDEFWETVVEYFGSAKGKIREVVVNDAVKIIEDVGDKGELEIDDDTKVKLRRARSVVQNLQ